MSRSGDKERKLNNWLLNFSYQHTGWFIFVVLFLCVLSFAVPVMSAKTSASTAAQICACGCTSGSGPVLSWWYYAAAGLTGLVNALAIVSVAIGIYSVAEARAASKENTKTCERLEDVCREMRNMQIQLETLQAGVKEARDDLRKLRYKVETGYGSAPTEEEDPNGESVDGNDN